jgi:hypothetical protein
MSSRLAGPVPLDPGRGRRRSGGASEVLARRTIKATARLSHSDGRRIGRIAGLLKSGNMSALSALRSRNEKTDGAGLVLSVNIGVD